MKIFGNRTEKAESTPTRSRGGGVPGLKGSTPTRCRNKINSSNASGMGGRRTSQILL